MLEPKDRLVSVEEAAFLLGLAEQTLYNQTAPGSKRPFPLKPRRIGRRVLFSLNELNNFMEGTGGQ